MTDGNLQRNGHLDAGLQFVAGDNVGRDFLKIASRVPALEWDLTYVAAMLSLGHGVGDRTVFRQVQRVPWLVGRGEGPAWQLSAIPPHGRKFDTASAVASRLWWLLINELKSCCSERSEIYVLLSGGLDSRIVAAALRHLRDAGEISPNIIAVTWGIDESCDVVIGREVAALLGFEWVHAPLASCHLESNIDACAEKLGALISPVHLHRMKWFEENASERALVVAGSFGDSVGRGEYSRRTVLELKPSTIHNRLGLLEQKSFEEAVEGVMDDRRGLRLRAGRQSEYVYLEHEQQAFYMRGLIAPAMAVIAQHCDLYQAFTAPEVYGYMWSLHPSVRRDAPYWALIRNYAPDLRHVPWARKVGRKSVNGVRLSNLSRDYHHYGKWAQQILRREVLQKGTDHVLGRFESLAFIRMDRLKNFVSRVEHSSEPDANVGLWSTLMWLMALHRMVERLDVPIAVGTQDHHLASVDQEVVSGALYHSAPTRWGKHRDRLKAIRRFFLRGMSLIRYPPVRWR